MKTQYFDLITRTDKTGSADKKRGTGRSRLVKTLLIAL